MKTFLVFFLSMMSVIAWAADDDDGMTAAREALLLPATPVEKPAEVGGDTKVVARKMEYNYKEAVFVATEDVVADNPSFRLTSDRLFAFFEGTNSLSQLVVMGSVTVSNDNRRAFCDKAVYTEATKQLVMVGRAKLTTTDSVGKQTTVSGDKITIWTDDQRIEVYPNPTLTLPGGSSDVLKGMMK